MTTNNKFYIDSVCIDPSNVDAIDVKTPSI